MATLKDLLSGTHSPITDDFNPPSLTSGLLGDDGMGANGQPNAVGTPQPQALFNLNAYPTPFGRLFRRPRNVITGT